MKMIVRIIVVLTAMLSVSLTSFAETEENRTAARKDKVGYIGAGGSYGVDAFRTSYGFDNATGFNFKAGFFWDERHSEILELDINHVGKFKSRPHGFAEVDITSYVIAMRHDLNEHDRFRIFFTWGIGALSGDLKTRSEIPGLDKSDTDFCVKGSLGADVFVTEDVALGIEAATYPGFGKAQEFSYYNFALSAKYFF